MFDSIGTFHQLFLPETPEQPCKSYTKDNRSRPLSLVLLCAQLHAKAFQTFGSQRVSSLLSCGDIELNAYKYIIYIICKI